MQISLTYFRDIDIFAVQKLEHIRLYITIKTNQASQIQ